MVFDLWPGRAEQTGQSVASRHAPSPAHHRQHYSNDLPIVFSVWLEIGFISLFSDESYTFNGY